MKNILVTIDFDDKVEPLVKKAVELAKAFGSKVWLMHIVEPEPDFVGYDIGPQYIRENIAETLKKEHVMLQKYADMLKEDEIDAEGILIQGPTIEMIIEESKKLKVDLIIAGHHEHGFLYKAFIGSVSSQIINKSKIPVLIVPLN